MIMSSDLLSVRTFNVARVLMALCVFFCHVFERFNNFGFLFVGVFFFMSGYGMEIGNKRMYSLKRVVPYIFYFAWFSFIYLFLYRVWVYPSGWFLVVYFVVMVVYRFFSNVYVLLTAFLLLGLFMYVCGFENGWSASYGGFLFGVLFARNPLMFRLPVVLALVPFAVMFFFRIEISLWALIPFFSWIVFYLSSRGFMSILACFAPYSFFFYCVHCLCLGLFGATWTLGGVPSLVSVFPSFVLSCVLSVFFKDYLFSYSRISS